MQEILASIPWTATVFFTGALIAAYIIRDVVIWWRLRHIPGPWVNSISVLALMRQIFKRNSAWYFTSLSDKYGPLVRIAPGEVMVTGADALRSINGVRSPYKRGPFFTAFRFIPKRDNIFSIQDDAFHTTHRAIMAPGYLGRGNEGLEVSIDRQLERLVNLIERKYVSTAQESRTCDLNLISHFLPLDIIGDAALGEPFGYLDEGEDLYRFVHVNGEFFIYAVTLACTPWVIGLLQKWPLKLLLPSDADVSGFGRIIGVATDIIDRRLRPGAKPGKDMLQAFIEAGLNRDELIQESIVQIVAGTDTIGSTIRMILACLLTHPDVYHRLLVEILTHARQGTLSSPAKDLECRNLPYLQAVIREAMRLYPPLTALAFKEVPPQGGVVAGYHLPGGTQVGQNIHGVLRDKTFWGPDADLFIPERWCDICETRAKDMNATLDLTFGHGKFKCLGRQLALAEANKFVVEILRRYEISAVSSHRPFHVAAAFGWPSDSFHLRLTRREDAAVV